MGAGRWATRCFRKRKCAMIQLARSVNSSAGVPELSLARYRVLLSLRPLYHVRSLAAENSHIIKYNEHLSSSSILIGLRQNWRFFFFNFNWSPSKLTNHEVYFNVFIIIMVLQYAKPLPHIPNIYCHDYSFQYLIKILFQLFQDNTNLPVIYLNNI